MADCLGVVILGWRTRVDQLVIEFGFWASWGMKEEV
jgi:hypothetical protein